MDVMNNQHTGRISQTMIYTGKLFRMFIFQNDWKVLPMAAIIAALVSYVVGGTLFKTMEGTLRGTFALSCICIWNGFFNSIQSICRERPIVKREHRSGLHMSSYVVAHMIYQSFLCLCQTVIVMVILNIAKVTFPVTSYMSGNVFADMGITMFLTTFAADMMALFVSALVRNTTTAMTIMPFLMIFQLIFSGGFFSLTGGAAAITDYSISKWCLNAMCAEGEYNSLPNGAILVALNKMNTEAIMSQAESLDYFGDATSGMSLEMLKEQLSSEEAKEKFTKKCGEMSYEVKYESDADNILFCWIMIIIQAVMFAGASIVALEFIDRDKR